MVLAVGQRREGWGGLGSLGPRNADYCSVSLTGTLSSENSRETCDTKESPCKEVFSSLSYGFSGSELSLSLSFSKFIY